MMQESISSSKAMRKSPTHMARILSPMGVYPAQSVKFKNAAYVASKKLSFSVYRITADTRGREGDDESYSEVQWLNPEEVRLYGSLLLSFDTENQFLAFYPHISVEPIFDGPDDLDDQWLSDEVAPMLIERMQSADVQIDGFPRPRPNQYRRHPDITLPKIISGIEYDFRGDDVDYQVTTSLYETIRLDDDLYIRGLYAIIKAGMFRSHHQFHEEGTYMLFIAMVVCLTLTLKKLRASGKANPTNEDAMRYIHEVFNEHHLIDDESSTKWFEEYYEQRVMSFHPESRVGIVPCLRMMHSFFIGIW